MIHSPLPSLERLFFALRPPPELARRIVAAAAWLGGDLLAAERLHVTLLILDDLAGPPPALIAALREVGAAVKAPPFTVALDRLVVAGRWAALRPGAANPPLAALYDQLARLARSLGIAERRDHRFNPHMTLGYRAAATRPERVRSVSWTAGELLLIRSHLGRTRHEVVDRWALTGSDPQLGLF